MGRSIKVLAEMADAAVAKGLTGGRRRHRRRRQLFPLRSVSRRDGTTGDLFFTVWRAGERDRVQRQHYFGGHASRARSAADGRDNGEPSRRPPISHLAGTDDRCVERQIGISRWCGSRARIFCCCAGVRAGHAPMRIDIAMPEPARTAAAN